MVYDLKKRVNNRYLIGKAADLPAGHRKIVRAGGREIGIFNIKGNFYALRNKCPHRGAPLCQGRIRPLVVATTAYEREYQREDEILKCPWHQWEYDIKSGVAIYDPTQRVKTYRVSLEADEIFLHTE